MALPKNQNFEVSATGGAGTNGQPARYAAGIDGAQDFYDLQTAAQMSGSNPAFSSVEVSTTAPPPSANMAESPGVL